MPNKMAVVLSVVSTVLLASQTPARSAPLMGQSQMAKSATASANTLEVRYGGWHGGWGRWNGGWRGGWGGWGWGAAALAGAAIAAPYYYGGYYPSYYAAPYGYAEPYSDYGYDGYYAYPGYVGYYRPYWRRYGGVYRYW